MAPDAPLPPVVADALDRLDALVAHFEAHPDPSVQEPALELVQCVDRVHRAGLQRLVALLLAADLLPRARAMPEVRLLLELYDLDGAPERPATAAPPPGFVPLASIQVRRRPRLVWRTVLRADEVPVGGVRALQIDDARVLLARVDGELFAYHNACPGTPLPLDHGVVADGTLQCPWHGCRFDLRGGQRRDAPGPGLGVLPVAVEDGAVRVGLQEGAAA